MLAKVLRNLLLGMLQTLISYAVSITVKHFEWAARHDININSFLKSLVYNKAIIAIRLCSLSGAAPRLIILYVYFPVALFDYAKTVTKH